MHRAGCFLGLAAVSLGGLVACAAPIVHAPALALVHDDGAAGTPRHVLLSLTGEGFGPSLPGTASAADCGLPGGGAFVILRGGIAEPSFTARARDPEVVPLWTDERIVVRAPAALADLQGVTVEVCAPGRRSGPVAVAAWRYDAFDVPRSDPGTNPSPVAVAIGADGTVFVNEEFHTQVKALSPDGAWLVHDVPQAPGPGIFASTLFGDDPTRIATLGEAVLVDPQGRTWWTESGTTPYGGPHANHSRILMVDPRDGVLRVWNVPGDDGGVAGIAFDPERRRVWFTQSKRFRRLGGRSDAAQEARLTSFDPDGIAPDPLFDFAPTESCEVPANETVGACSATRHRRCLTDRDCTLAHQVCAPGVVDDRACFHEHELPAEFGVVIPGPLLRHSDGTLWYSAFWGGNHVGRFDPGTGRFQRYPLPRPPGEADCDGSCCWCFLPDGDKDECPARCCRYLLLGLGPWGLAEAPGDDVLFTTQEGGALVRFDVSRKDDPACTTLDAAGRNPCLREDPIPGFHPARDAGHSLALDADGNVWVGQGVTLEAADVPAAHAPLAVFDAATARFRVLPPLSLLPYTSTGRECTAKGREVPVNVGGVAIDPRTGAVFFADYCRKRLGRLVPLAR